MSRFVRSIGFAAVAAAVICVVSTGCKKDVAEKPAEQVEAKVDEHAAHDHSSHAGDAHK